MALSQDAAFLITALAQTGAYGIYLVLFPASIYSLYEHRKSLPPAARTHNSVLFGAALLLCCLITTNWVLSMDATRQTYSNPAESVSVEKTTQSALLVFETVVLDAILIYRVYAIWAKRFVVIIIPTLCLIGSLVTGIPMCFVPAQLPITSTWYQAWLSLSLTTNGLAVALISYRLWSLNRDRIRAAGETSLSFVSIVIMESAAVYCVCNLGALIAQVLGSFVMLVFLGLMTVATGIAFSLLLIRVREERRSRLLQRMMGVVETPPPLHPHAIELTSKSSELA